MEDAKLDQLNCRVKQLQTEIENTEKVQKCLEEQLTKIEKIQRNAVITQFNFSYLSDDPEKTAKRYLRPTLTIKDPALIKLAINVMFRSTTVKVHRCFKQALNDHYKKLQNEHTYLQRKINRNLLKSKIMSLWHTYNPDTERTTIKITPHNNSK